MALAAPACTGSAREEFSSRVITLGDGEVYAEIANSTLAVGENRFVLLLFDEKGNPLFGRPILGAQVRPRFFDLNSEEPRPGPDADARAIQIDRNVVHQHEDGTVERHGFGPTAYYIAYVRFDHPGRWGVEINVVVDGEKLDPIPFQFDVLEKSREPAIGDPAPATRQPTLSDVEDIAEIDTSFPPRPHMHEMTVADALGSGKPVVLAFATPAFCVTRICAPTMDTVMDPLYKKYKDQAIFIHIEPWKLKEAREGTGLIPVEAMEEWNLRTEPWVFVIDREGEIVGKFEGIVAPDEVEAVLERALCRHLPKPVKSMMQ